VRRADPEGGSATVLGLAVIGLVVLVGVLLVTLLAAVAVRIEAETAADAAALAAVVAAIDGRSPAASAAEVAAANGARLVRCRCPGHSEGTFSATVRITREVRIPILGTRTIDVERSAEYAADP
jgi:secretion/DNA translocation related TadE-like protein